MPAPELVVISHLRWIFVWQRPQHLISRIGRGRRTWFVEEPWSTVVGKATIRSEDHPGVTRVWLDVPGESEWHVPFDDPRAAGYADELKVLLGSAPDRTVWIYTPMGLELARALAPTLLVYDVMDDLASFAKASRALKERQRQALAEADLVFTGGRSLHEAVRRVRPDAHLFPSGVEPEHYAAARALRTPRSRPVAGYVGVIDERLDLELIRELADALPGWEIQMVGPVSEKIDAATLPQAPNLVYLGKQPYERLPEVMAGFDVALMPFALNEATRSISPTKTLEYFAAGLPVVSTPVPDVVADYGDVIDVESDGHSFARACERALRADAARLEEVLGPLLHRQHWDTIASRMKELLDRAAERSGAAKG